MPTNAELKTTMKQMRRLSTYEVRALQRRAQAVGDHAMALRALAELRRRGR